MPTWDHGADPLPLCTARDGACEKAPDSLKAVAENKILTHLVVAIGQPQCLNNVQGANCIDQSLVQRPKGRLSTGYSTEHPHNWLGLPVLQSYDKCFSTQRGRGIPLWFIQLENTLNL